MGKYRIETEDGHTYEIETEDPAPAYPSPTLPKDLQGPPASRFRQAIQNIPSSAIHAIANPYGPGVPQGNPTFEGDYHGPTPESVGNELKSLIPHPIDDPVGTALQLATLGKFRRPIAAGAKGAAAGASEMVPMRHYGVPMDVPAPIAGAAAGGFAGWLSHLPHAQEIGAAIGGAAPIVRGAYRGVKEALADPSARFREDALRPTQGLGGEAPIVKSPVAPVVSPEQAVMPPGFRNRPAPPSNEPVFQPPESNIHPMDVKPPYPFTPQEAASQNTHAPGVIQADEFLPPKVSAPSPIAPPQPQPIPPTGASPIAPPSGLTPVGGRVEPNGPSTPSATEVIKPNTPPPGEPLLAPPEQPGQRHNSVQAHLEGIKNKIDNLIAHAQGVGMKVEDLERLHEEATQVDDPAVQHNAFEELKDLGRNAYESSKKSGRKVPASKYRSVSLDTLNDAIRVWKSMPKPDQP